MSEEHKAILMKQLWQDEEIREYSRRKPNLWVGISCLLIGAAVMAEAVLYIFSVFSAVALAAALAFLYLGIRYWMFDQKECVCVTNRRAMYQKVNWRGRYGSLVWIPLDDICGVRLYRLSVMYVANYSGAVILKLKDGRRYVLPSLVNGQYIMEAIYEEMKQSSTIK